MYVCVRARVPCSCTMLFASFIRVLGLQFRVNHFGSTVRALKGFQGPTFGRSRTPVDVAKGLTIAALIARSLGSKRVNQRV